MCLEDIVLLIKMTDVKITRVNNLDTPALVIYKNIAQANASRMLKLAKEYGVQLRPHFKTTKCLEAAIMQTGETKRCMVVSTVAEAEFLQKNGFEDLLYASPLAVDKIERCSHLTEMMDKFLVMVDNFEIVERLEECSPAGKPWLVVVKVSCNNGRAGILYDDPKLLELARYLYNSRVFSFEGLYAHDGDSYYSTSLSEVQKVSQRTTEQLLQVVDALKAENITCKMYGIGSTPTCSNPVKIMSKLTEWHPGNYILYDQMQAVAASCQDEDVACVVVTQVIGHYPDKSRNFMIINCGWTALSLHGLGNCCGKTPGSGYGKIVGHPELKLTGMTQEHGIVKASDQSQKLDFSKYPIGFLFKIKPDHSCATCAMHSVYHVADENEHIVEKWIPAQGW